MNKQELAAQVATETGMTASAAQKAVDACLTAITNSLQNRQDVRLVGFGTFTTSERAAREGRNPQTGEALKIAASVQAKFKPGQVLKDSLNDNVKKK